MLRVQIVSIVLSLVFASGLGCLSAVEDRPEGTAIPDGSSAVVLPDGGSSLPDVGPSRPDSGSSHPDGGPFLGPGLLPGAPAPGTFMWQGLQESFVTAQGVPCRGRVTIAMGDRALCFVAADDSMRCAGKIYKTNYGTTFAATGQTGVDQITLSLTANSEDGNGICIHRTDRTIHCMGSGSWTNTHGQFGVGDTAGHETFVQWGGRGGLVALATGTWDQMCALDESGVVLCSGFGFGSTPVAQPGTGHRSLWVTTFGNVSADDGAVLRAGAGRSECQVTATGLTCPRHSIVRSGIVDGNETQPMAEPNFGQDVCALDDRGTVRCDRSSDYPVEEYTTEQRFSLRPVLALAVNPYTNSLCAVYDDGSLACVGRNDQGKLGSGNTQDLAVETVVAPPGTVRVDCR